MTQLQKIIKYAAMAFAIFLAVSIIGGIVSAVIGVSFAFDVFTVDKEIGQSTADEITATFDADTITALEIDLAASDLRIERGTALQVTTNKEDVTVRQKGDTLIIEEETRLFSNEMSTVTLTVPQDYAFLQAEIDAGAGKIDADALQAEYLSLSLGAGEAVFDRLDAAKDAEIETGAGKLVVKDGTLGSLDLELGIGKVELASKLVGDSKVECGVGALELTLRGSEADYTVVTRTGVGSFKVDGTTVTENTTLGKGAAKVTIEGGIGTVDVEFAA